MRWVAVYSKTGGEIERLSTELGRKPDLILKDPADLREHLLPSDLVTLHGYMRIVPADVCADFTIYNGHPGLITKYPELKGKDPQERAFDHLVIGSVVHKVIAEVDSGEIVAASQVANMCPNVECVYKTLQLTSLRAWVTFFKEFDMDKTKDNGGSTHYYDFEPGWKEAGDIIEGRKMNFNEGNIFKVAFCFNKGRHSATDKRRELNKIVYFAQRELACLDKEEADASR